MRRLIPLLAATAAAVLLTAMLAGCQAEDPVRPAGDAPAVITVPGHASTIQAAVDAAQPGDTVEIGPGTYPESVTVATPDLVIRGTDRNGVVLDGGGIRTSGVVVTAPRVRVENLTVHDYTLYGVLITGMADGNGGLARGSGGYTKLDPEKFPPLVGFAVQYVTATNNGLYGIYAFDSHHGLIAHNYASGSSDSGLYVGQCQQCDILVRDNVAEFNAVGYEQANASDSVVVVRNRFTDNRLGMTLISNYQEAFVPLRGSYVAGNLVANNDNPATPAHAEGGFGVGIGISGGQAIEVTRNRIVDNPLAGVQLASTEDLAPKDNQLVDNSWHGNATDIAYTASERAPGSGNCVAGAVGRTLPDDMSGWTCPAGNKGGPGVQLPKIDVPPGLSYREVTAPGALPSMPPGSVVDLERATEFDRSGVAVPAGDLLVDQTQGRTT